MSRELTTSKQLGKAKPVEKTNQKSTQKATAQIGTRFNSVSELGRPPIEDIRADQTELIKNAGDAKEYLIRTQYLPPGTDVTVSAIINALFYLSADKSSNKTVTCVARSLAFLLSDSDLRTQAIYLANSVNNHLDTLWVDSDASGTPVKEAARVIKEVVSKTLTTQINKRVEELEEKMAQSIENLSSSLTKLTESSHTYRQALLQPPPGAAPTASLIPTSSLHASQIDPKLVARQATKSRQILVEFSEAEDKDKAWNTSLTELVESANTALEAADPLPGGKFINATKLPHGGILFEMDSSEAATWTTQDDIGTAFAKHLAPSAHIRQRLFNVVAYFVPITFNAGEQDGMREIEDVNRLPVNSLRSTRWIKPLYRRSARQRFAHAILSFSTPRQANKAIMEGLTICHKRVEVIKDKREPIRCMKCQLWGHVANSCSSPHDICGTCAQAHRTKDCTSDAQYCTPCKEEGHTSWDRDCPTFERECKKVNQKNPDNQLTYFPTDEPWTYATKPPTGQNGSSLPTQAQRPLAERIGPLMEVAQIRQKNQQRKHANPPHRAPTQPPSSAPGTSSLPTTLLTAEATSSRITLEDLPRWDARSSYVTHRPPGKGLNANPIHNNTGKTPGEKRIPRQSTLHDFMSPTPHPSATASMSLPLHPPATPPPFSATQILEDVIPPSANRFAAIAPPDEEDQAEAGPSVQDLPRSQDSIESMFTNEPPRSPRSPVPSQPRPFPSSFMKDWDAQVPSHPSRPLSPTESDFNVSLGNESPPTSPHVQ